MTIDPRFYELISHLWRGGKYGYYWTPDGPQRTDDDGSTYTVSQTYWTSTSNPAKVPPIWKNAYFGVNPTSTKYGEHKKASLDDVTCINALYAEFDEKDFATADKMRRHVEDQLPPSVIVHSGGGYHCYWLLRDTVPVTEVTPSPALAQHAWVRLVGGDHTVHDLARVLRVPGTLNHKYNPPAPVDIIHFDMSQLYEYADLVAACDAEIQAIQDEAARVVHSGAGVSLSDQELLNKAMSAPSNGAQFTRLWQGQHDGDHSAADQALCNLLAYWTGKDEARMDSLFRASGLYRDKWERDSYRTSTIQRAVKGVRNVYDPSQSKAYQESQRAVEGVVEMSTGKADDKPTLTPQAAPQGDPFLLESADDRGNAVCMWHRYGDMFAWTAGFGYLWYNGSHWTTDGAEAELRKAVTATLTERRMKAVGANHEKLVAASKPSATNVRNCIYMFQPLITTTEANFDADPNLLNCANGVIDLRTGQLMPHDSRQRFTYCVPVEYDPSADYVDWIEFLHGVTDPSMIDFLQMAVGYSATGHTREECLFYVHGPTRSGKGTFAETLLELFPRPLGVQADFSTFTAERQGDTQNFDLAPLKPSRFIVASESKKYESLNEAKVKSITGGDYIRCAFKYRDHFNYRPQFKIWLMSNHPVSGDVDDEAFWGRLRVVEFPHTFKGREDKCLKQKMKSPENLRGVLAWLVAGAVRWHNEPQGLPIPQQVKDATNKHRNELDYVQQWLDECCDADPKATSWTANSLIYQSYSEWCQDNGLKPKGQKMLGRSLTQKGFDIGERRYPSNGKRTRGVTGITVN